MEKRIGRTLIVRPIGVGESRDYGSWIRKTSWRKIPGAGSEPSVFSQFDVKTTHRPLRETLGRAVYQNVSVLVVGESDVIRLR